MKRPFVAGASIGKAGPALKRAPDGAATFALDNPVKAGWLFTIGPGSLCAIAHLSRTDGWSICYAG